MTLFSQDSYTNLISLGQVQTLERKGGGVKIWASFTELLKGTPVQIFNDASQS